MKSALSMTAIALACSTMFAPSMASAYAYANGAAVEIDVSSGDYTKKVIGGQSAKGDLSAADNYNWNNGEAIPGAQTATGLLQDLNTSVVIKGSHWVTDEVVGGSYIHPNDNDTKKAVLVHLNSTSVVIDGAKIREGVVGGSKTNNWSSETVNFTTDSTSIRIRNGAQVEKFVLGGDALKFASRGSDDYCALTSGVVNKAEIVVEGDSAVGGLVAGSYVQHNNTIKDLVKAVGEVKEASVVVDSSTVKPIGYVSDKPYDFDAPYAIVAGGLIQTTAKWDMSSKVGESWVVVQNNSKVEGDVLLGGLLLVDKAPASVQEVNAKLDVDKVALQVSDSVVNGSIVSGNRTHYDVTDVQPDASAPEGLSGTVEEVRIALHNATVRDAVTGLGTEKSTLALSGVNKIGTLSDFPSVDLTATAANNLASGGQPILTLTGSSVDLSDVTLNLYGELDAGADVAVLKVENVNAITGTGETTIVGHGTFVDQTWKGTAEDLKTGLEDGQLNTGNIAFEATANSNTKTLSEVRLGSVAMVNQGAEFIADEGVAAIRSAARRGGVSAFGAVAAGSSKYETGSSVDLDSWNLVVGAASMIGDVTLAGFAEYGTGSSEAEVAHAKADGDHGYYGVGIAARWDAASGVFVDGALRLGMSNTEFSGVYASNGASAQYDGDAFYSTFHVGAGYVFPIGNAVEGTVYGRYAASYLEGDTLNLEGTTNLYDADSVTTQALRVGLRATGGVMKTAEWRAGLAYEHAFGGDADATVSGIALDAPSLDGDTGILEAGFTIKPSDALPSKIDFDIKGYVGDRQGVSGTAMAVYNF